MTLTDCAQARPEINQIGLVMYRPRSGDPDKVIAAVWKKSGRIHWSSPCVGKVHQAFNPQPFISRFPLAQGEVTQFERAMSWFDAICYSAHDVGEVASACASDGDSGLRLKPYFGSQSKDTLKKTIEEDTLPIELMTESHFTASLVASLQNIARENPYLKDASLEILSNHPFACARLHLQTKKVLVIIDRNTAANHIVPRLVRENTVLTRREDTKSHTLIVFSKLSGVEPVALTPRVIGSSLDFCALSKSIERLLCPKTKAEATVDMNAGDKHESMATGSSVSRKSINEALIRRHDK
jgi:hypothetical protein